MTFDRTIWRPLVAELEAIDPGRRVLAIDLPGHGESPDQATYGLDQITDQVHAAVEEAGLDAPVVVGHSAGGVAATIYAAKHPTRGVVDVDQVLQVGSFAELVRSLAPRLRGPEFPAVWAMFYGSFHTELLPPAAQELVRSTCHPRQDVVLGYWRQLLEQPDDEVTTQADDGIASLRHSGVPFLHIAGEDPGDGYRQWLSQRLPTAAIEVWPRSGHFPHLARPEQFGRRLADTAGWHAGIPTGQ
jgi:pimeloyl-ACP methyl ester carboxylesterase